MSLTTDPDHPDLKRGGPDDKPVPQQEVYLVLSEEDRKKGFVQPLRKAYTHRKCGTTTTMGSAIAETYARDPWFYGSTYCVQCSMHKPLSEFTWLDGSEVDPSEWSDEQLQLVRDRQKKSVE
jgi:hypothetical protein